MEIISATSNVNFILLLSPLLQINWHLTSANETLSFIIKIMLPNFEMFQSSAIIKTK